MRESPARFGEMRFSQRSQFAARFIWPIHFSGGDLRQRAIDLLVESPPFCAGPRLLGFERLQRAPGRPPRRWYIRRSIAVYRPLGFAVRPSTIRFTAIANAQNP